MEFRTEIMHEYGIVAVSFEALFGKTSVFFASFLAVLATLCRKYV